MLPPFDGRICLGMETFDMLTLPRGGQSHALVRTPSTAISGIPTEMIQTLAAAYQVPMDARARIFQENTWDVSRFTPCVENNNTACNSLGMCYRFFIGRTYNPVVLGALYSSVTGINAGAEDILKSGERTWNLQKVMNVREGFGRKDDKFPDRWFREPIKSGDKEFFLQDYCKTKKLTPEDAEAMLSSYYDERGWDIRTGHPTEERLASLGLGKLL